MVMNMALTTSTSCLTPFSSSSSSSTTTTATTTRVASVPSLRSLCFSSATSSRTSCRQLFSFPSANKKVPTLPLLSPRRLITRAAEYKFPDPIPEFADAETEKFRNHLLNKLSKKDMYKESVEEVVGVCTEIFSTFLHSEYGGPGTLLVVPFIDMADAINERGLPGGPQAARAAIKWAQNHVDNDWDEWNGVESGNSNGGESGGSN